MFPTHEAICSSNTDGAAPIEETQAMGASSGAAMVS